MKKLNLKPGEEIELGIKGNTLIIRPKVSKGRKLYVEAKIILVSSALVSAENEALNPLREALQVALSGMLPPREEASG